MLSHDRARRPDVRTLLKELFSGNREAQLFLVALLHPLERYDKANGTDLLQTLEAYLESDLSTGSTAGRLGVHRHTVAYRLNQIERVLGHSVRSGTDRLSVELAIEARRLRP